MPRSLRLACQLNASRSGWRWEIHAVLAAAPVRTAVIFTRMSLLLWGLLALPSIALGDDGVSVSITNDSSDVLIVTIYDLTSKPSRIVVNAQRINGFASILVSITAGNNGLGAVSWKARNADQNDAHCGRGRRDHLKDEDVVNVHAESECPASGSR